MMPTNRLGFGKLSSMNYLCGKSELMNNDDAVALKLGLLLELHDEDAMRNDETTIR